MGNGMVFLLCGGLVVVGVIFLQIFLSKQESKWAGLVLPAITLCISILVVLGVSAFTIMQTVQDEKVIFSTVDNHILGAIVASLYVFVLYNIPTAILMAIYIGCRGRRKRNAELEKMSLQDLD